MVVTARLVVGSLRWGLRWAWRLALALVLVLGALLWVLRNGPVTAPHWVTAELVRRIDTVVAPLDLQAEVDRVAFDLRSGGVPALVASGVRLHGPAGADHVALDRLEAVLAREPLLSGRVRLAAIRASGLGVALRRDDTGALDLDLGQKRLVTGAAGGTEILTALRGFLDQPFLSELRLLGVTDVAFTLTDAARARALTSRGGVLRVTRDGPGLDLSLDLGQIGAAETGRALLQMSSPGAARELSLRLALRGLVPAELSGLAGRSPLSELLARFDAPVSLAMSGAMLPGGNLQDVTGELSVGAGAVTLPGRAVPMPLESLHAQLGLNAAADHLRIEGLDLSTPVLSLKGRADLRRALEDPGAAQFTAQLALSDLRVQLPGMFDAPQAFDGLWASLAYGRTDDTVRIADLSLRQGDLLLHASGRAAGLAGPQPVLALDFSAPQAGRDQILSLWPLDRAKGARRWIDESLHDATFEGIAGALRMDGRGPVDLGLSFGFHGAALTPARGLPDVTDGHGVGQILDGELTFAIEAAKMQAPTGEAIALSDGLVRIAPLFSRGSNALQARFSASADVSAALAILALPVFDKSAATETPSRPLLQSGQADGAVSVDLRLDLPLRKGTKMSSVNFGVSGQVEGFSTRHLVPDRRLSAARLILSASPRALQISGPVQLDGHPFLASYQRPLGPATAAGVVPRVTASGALTPELAQDFGLTLPPGAATGAGRLELHVDLPKGAAPQLALDGDLTGLRLRLADLGLHKNAAQAGQLHVAGRLGEGGALDVIRLTFSGLTLDASAPLRDGGGLGPLTLRQLVIGDWLDAKGSLTQGAPGQGLRVALTGGQVDLRRKPGGGGGGGGKVAGIDLALDTVRINDTLALRDVRGALTGQGNGSLTARLNGAVPVTLRLAPAASGNAIDVTAADAGAVLAAANLAQGIRGGAFNLRLVPTGAAQTYRGRMRITDTALKEAGAAARIVSALSVVGAFEQMAGSGITFSDVRADFTLSPNAVRLHSGSAVGPSLGLSFDGLVDLASKRLDLQGVVSPVYFLNRAGAFMTRRGEGLLGLSYTVKGSFDAPKVAANPLSVLAPGFLREIFRRRPESTGTEGQE
ncbi:MAG: hypothetical protein KDA50_08980 [Rhodobacteraceae bacterium]|nr:hypothetical protein [Paracoccaceae bacterium]